MGLLDEVAAQAEPLQVSTSDLVRRIRRRRRLAAGAGVAAALVIVLTATAQLRPQATQPLSPSVQPSAETTTQPRDSQFSCGQIISDVVRDSWATNKRNDAMAVVSRSTDNEGPMIAVGFTKNPAPALVQTLLVKGRVIVGHGVSISTEGYAGTSSSRGVPQVLCPPHTWKQAWADDDYLLILLAASRQDDPSPQLLGAEILKRSIVNGGDIMMIHTHCGVHGFMHEEYWWEAFPKLDLVTDWDDPYQIGQIEKLSATEIRFTTPTGKKGTFRKTSHQKSQAPPCD